MAERNITTGWVRGAYIDAREMYGETFAQYYQGAPVPDYGAEFDAWLAEHDAEVRIDYEKNRTYSAVIENIDGVLAAEWLRKHDRDLWYEGYGWGLSDGQRSDGFVTDNPYEGDN